MLGYIATEFQNDDLTWGRVKGNKQLDVLALASLNPAWGYKVGSQRFNARGIRAIMAEYTNWKVVCYMRQYLETIKKIKGVRKDRKEKRSKHWSPEHTNIYIQEDEKEPADRTTTKS